MVVVICHYVDFCNFNDYDVQAIRIAALDAKPLLNKGILVSVPRVGMHLCRSLRSVSSITWRMYTLP